MAKPVATKANLIKTKNLLDFSIRGFDLLDKKRTVLIREMMALMNKAKTIEAEIADLFSDAYRAIEYVNITMGTDAVMDIARAIPLEEPFQVRIKSVMGVELPQIVFEKKPVSATYGFFRSNPSLDIAVSSFTKVKYLSYELAEVENAIFKLAMEIKKTQKRANSLDKIQIPKFREYLKTISSELEEKEREDFFRLKRVKNKQARG